VTIEVENDPSPTLKEGDRTASPSGLGKKTKGVTFGENQERPKSSALETYAEKVALKVEKHATKTKQ
jgi:hypothetical protein